MSLATILPMHRSSPTTPLRHPAYRPKGQRTPSPTFIDRWRDRQRSDLAAKIKSAREQAATDARGGDDEMMRVIFRGEERRRIASMEKEASLIHRETLDHLEETEGDVNPDEALLEELLRKEEEEVLALLAAREEPNDKATEMQDVIMSDIDIEG